MFYKAICIIISLFSYSLISLRLFWYGNTDSFFHMLVLFFVLFRHARADANLGVLVLGINTHRAVDDAYKTFLSLVSSQVSDRFIIKRKVTLFRMS